MTSSENIKSSNTNAMRNRSLMELRQKLNQKSIKAMLPDPVW
jgi:hypothetical protein